MLYFAMEYVQGLNLDAYCREHFDRVRPIVELFVRVCDAVAHAHQKGVLHRDIKPSNIIVDATGAPHILDFGLARPIGEDGAAAVVTQAGEFTGTWYYASPEQILRDSAAVDIRTDVYALGVILYELVTNCYPYPIQGQSPGAIADHIQNTWPLAPRAINAEIDRDLETIILRSLSKGPDRRYQSAFALADDLRRYLVGEVIEARRDSTWYVTGRMLHRYRWWALSGASALVALIVFAATVTFLYAQARSAHATTEARMELVRQTQRSTLQTLDEYHRVANGVAALDETDPDGRLVRRLRRTVDADLLATMRDVATSLPVPFRAAVEGDPQLGDGTLRRWLEENDGNLADICARLRQHRVVPGLQAVQATGFLIDDNPIDVDHLKTVAHILRLRAARAWASAERQTASESLAGARAIALDLSDHRTPVAKRASYLLRYSLYDQWLQRARREQGAFHYDELGEWLSDDPPLAEYHLGIGSERARVGQFLESAIVAGPNDRGGYLDLERLDAAAAGLLRESGRIRPSGTDSRPPASAAGPILERYFNAMAEWDRLSAPDILAASKALSLRLNEEPLWAVLNVLLPNETQVFLYRGRCRSARSALFLLEALHHRRALTGSWPATLQELLPSVIRAHARDAVSGLPFGYRLREEGPMLYSANEDGVDNGGVSGRWGEKHTDFVFFDTAEKHDGTTE